MKPTTSLDRKNTTAATNMLRRRVINEIEELIQAGRLSSTDGQLLIDAAQSAIGQLEPIVAPNLGASQSRAYAMTNLTPRGSQRRTGQERRVRNIGPGKRERRSGEEALAVYDEALRLDPQNADAHHNRGISLRNLGRHE